MVAQTDFLIAISAFEIGLLLFFLNRKQKFKKIAESMTILVLIMGFSAATIPLLAQYKESYVYFYLPIYLLSINAWLFFSKYVVFGKIVWQIEDEVKKGVRKMYLVLAFGFIAVLILLITFIPHNLKL